MDGNNSGSSNGSNGSIVYLEQRSVKTIKRCPFCNSSSIYKRTRTAWRKIDIKSYRCYRCKQEFNVPITGEKISICAERIW